mmetsp:Transcript_129597/g.415560  ORF Transcript_129597/g.415560 Transcript_129597/m.415560 type:complete len:241 (+) Transcript_129597:5053-5775(+)
MASGGTPWSKAGSAHPRLRGPWWPRRRGWLLAGSLRAAHPGSWRTSSPRPAVGAGPAATALPAVAAVEVPAAAAERSAASAPAAARCSWPMPQALGRCQGGGSPRARFARRRSAPWPWRPLCRSAPSAVGPTPRRTASTAGPPPPSPPTEGDPWQGSAVRRGLTGRSACSGLPSTASPTQRRLRRLPPRRPPLPPLLLHRPPSWVVKAIDGLGRLPPHRFLRRKRTFSSRRRMGIALPRP